jgi:hypothetical protein
LKKRNSPISLSELTIEMGPCDVGYKTKRQLELLYPKLGYPHQQHKCQLT